MIKKLDWKILIKSNEKGYFVISSSSTIGHEYFREPTKKELVDKINEIVECLNLQKLN